MTTETKQKPTPGLYVIATPIGNPEDITLRALKILAAADCVACEDTRMTNRLLGYHGIKASMIIYNDHSSERERQQILTRLAEGKTVALVSDAGMPMISDPGYKLINDVREQGYAVHVLPGASAVTTALPFSGLPSDRFCFHGFLSSKSQGRKNELAALKDWPVTHVFFESPRRLPEMLADMLEVCGNRDVAVTRELTKTYEECRRAPLSELVAHYQANPDVKGEIVVLMAPPSDKEQLSEAELDAQLLKALESMRLKEAVAFVVEHTGLNKKHVYERALTLSGKK